MLYEILLIGIIVTFCIKYLVGKIEKLILPRLTHFTIRKSQHL